MEFITSILIISIFIIGLVFLKLLKSKYKKTFNFRVLTALIGGLLFGAIIQLVFGVTSEITNNLTTFASLISGLYVSLLKLIVIPLIFVSIVMAIVDAGQNSNLGKKLVQIISVLLFTVAIAAIIGIVVSLIFNIDASAIVNSAQSLDAGEVSEKALALEQQQESFKSLSYAQLLLAPVPTDFSFMVGMGATAALSTVLFSGFLGYAILQINKRKPEKSKTFIEFIASLKEVVLSMVREILKLTPFGIFALMTSFMATSSVASLGELLKFVIATYVAIIVMYLVHLVIISIQGINPITYAKKTWSVLVFGFGSRSSMATIPLNVETQVESLGVNEGTANLSATLGATIGQNGCAGIYPAMVALLAAQLIPDFKITLSWILLLIIVIIISSFGVAGVGGGATFAAIAVLTIMNLPVEVAALLIGVEPLLDMARTALNISDSMIAGVTVSNMNNEIDKEILNN